VTPVSSQEKGVIIERASLDPDCLWLLFSANDYPLIHTAAMMAPARLRCSQGYPQEPNRDFAFQPDKLKGETLIHVT
jgi:hypothetical protein